MKKLLLTTLLLMVLPLSFSYAGDIGVLGFGGARISADETNMSVGFGHKIGGLWAFTYTDIGKYGSLSTELAVMKRSGDFMFGFISGPDVDWVGTGDTPVAYLMGASGLIANYTVSDKYAVFGYVKHKWALKSDTNAPTGQEFGFGISAWL